MDLPQPEPLCAAPPAERSEGALERLWTPWRMRYVAGTAQEDGCVFCNRLAADDDVASLIVHRGDRSFLILNLFPYNTGHLMLVPNQHVASPEQADAAALEEMARLLPSVLSALRRTLHCDGFNLGINVGAVAGAGVADHLHQHVVPRWEGDANFMPILASTMVLPELIPVTYAKVRAEVSRQLGGPVEVVVVLLSADESAVLACQRSGMLVLPRATPRDDEPVWKAAVRMAQELVEAPVEIVGWGGSSRTGSLDQSALVTRIGLGEVSYPHEPLQWMRIDDLMAAGLDDADRRLLSRRLLDSHGSSTDLE